MSLDNHYFQSPAWAASRQGSAWRPVYFEFDGKTLLAYKRGTPLGVVVHIAGVEPQPGQIPALTKAVKAAFPKALTCKLETCQPYSQGLAKSLEQHGWQKARVTQYAFTVQFDLTKSVDDLKKNMKKRARNELNRAVNNGVQVQEVQPTDDQLETMYRMLINTAGRKHFSVHDKQTLFTFWQAMRQSGHLKLFYAVMNNEILAAAAVALSQDGKKAWYKEGASTTAAPGVNAPRLLLWEAAQKLKVAGVETFDLGGVPDPATYEQSEMKGIFIFKTAYTPEVTQMTPAYELPIQPTRYKAWPKMEIALRKLAQKRHSNWFY